MGSPVTITPDQIAITPDSPAQPPEKPGMWQRFREGLGLPSLDEIKASMQRKPTTGDTVKSALLGPAAPAVDMATNYAKTAAKGIGEGFQEVKQASENLRDTSQPILPNIGKGAYGIAHATFQAIPFVGPAAENVGNDLADDNPRGAVGGAAGVMAQAALPELAERGAGAVSKAKTALTITPEMKAAAAEVPDAATAATAARTAKDINTGATQELGTKLHAEFDDVAKQVGADVADAPSPSVKSHRIGDKLQKDAQAMYQKADEIANKVSGQPGRFQQFQQDIRGLRDQIRASYDPTIKAGLEQQLGTAQTQYAQYQQAMADAGMDVNFVKQADKQWSIGTSYKEVGHKLATGELLSGDLRPSATPLNNAVKAVSKEGAKRGHVLENAMGEDRASRVTDAVDSAAARVQRESAATKSAKESVKQTTERAAEAQKGIERVQKNRKTLAKGAASAVLGGAAVTGASKYGGALFGKDD